ncbi:MAG: cell division protein SepF [Oscillospiraceae bacterium]|nr:cell division protein SepF [Oscillospiraceae bacterium]
MSFLNTVKNFIGLETDEYYDDEYYDEDDVEEEDSAPRASTHTFPRRTSSKVVPLNSVNQSRVRIIKPENFDASTKVADEVKGGRMVIFDVGMLDADEARRIVDFVAGAVYGVSGNIRRVSGGIFVAAPRNIDITGDNIKEQARNSFDWAM